MYSFRILVCIQIIFLAFNIMAQTKSDEEQIMQLEDEWTDALIKEDRKELDRILAPEFSFIEPDGSVLDREAYLEDRSHYLSAIESFEIEEVKVRVYGQSSLVSGISKISERRLGRKLRYDLRWKELWIKQSGKWVVVAGQATPVNPKWEDPFLVKE